MMIRTHRSCENDPQSRAMTRGPASEGSQTRGPPPCRGPRRGRTAAAAPPAPAPAPGTVQYSTVQYSTPSTSTRTWYSTEQYSTVQHPHLVHSSPIIFLLILGFFQVIYCVLFLLSLTHNVVFKINPFLPSVTRIY